MDPKITLYKDKDFKGRTVTFTESIPNFVNVGFNDTLSSVDVQGGVWIFFSDINYQGNIYVVKEGDRVNVSGYNDKASSVKLINYDFSDPPSCTLYADSNYWGRSLNLTADALNLKWYDFNDRVSSIRVQSGAWVAYTDRDFGGKQSFYLQGGHSLSASEGSFPNDSISSMRAIQTKPSGPITILKFDFDLSRAIITNKPSVVFQWTQINDSSVEQNLSITTEKSITKDNTYEFHWKQGTSITASMEMSVGIPVLSEGKLTMSATASYEVGSKTGTRTSKTEKWVVKFPSRIPARTQLILSSVLTEGRYDVPYIAVLKQGNKTWTEQGVFRGVNYYGFVTDFKEEPL